MKRKFCKSVAKQSGSLQYISVMLECWHIDLTDVLLRPES